MSIVHSRQRSGCSANSIASEKASCPVEQPTDQIDSRREACRRSASAGQHRGAAGDRTSPRSRKK
jgi:uncharacterized membrane protein